MIRVASIVEGHGEVEALPVLLRRIADWRPGDDYVEPLRPIRVSRDRFLHKEKEFCRQLILAAKKCGEDGWILVLLDADDDCPADLAREIAARAQKHVPHSHLSVVLANREFEAWFIASAASIDGHRGFHMKQGDEMADAELPRDAKGWLCERMEARTYGEVLDQPAFAGVMNPEQALANSRSFRKLCKEWTLHVQKR